MLAMIQTETSVQHLFILVSNRLDDLQNRLKQTEITQSSRLVIELLSSGILRDSDEDIRRRIRQTVKQRILLGFFPQIRLYTFQRRITLALQTHKDARWKKEVDVYLRGHQMMPP